MFDHSSIRKTITGSPGSARRHGLTCAEAKLWNALRHGHEADLRSGPTQGNGHLPRGASDVRGDMLADILRGDMHQATSPRLVLRGAHIAGRLDLDFARIDYPVVMRECTFDEPITLIGARLAGLTITGGELAGISARNSDLDGDLTLTQVICRGTVDLGGAHLHHNLDLRGATLSSGKETHIALCADHATVDGSVYCSDGFTVAGTVSMTGAHILGVATFDGATIASDGEAGALEADGLTVRYRFSARKLIATGEVRLVDANIDGSLELCGAQLNGLNNPDRISLRLDRAQISGSVYCDKEFFSAGQVAAIGAHIRGTVYFTNAELGAAKPPNGTGPEKKSAVALRLLSVKIDGNLGCWENFIAHGTIILSSSQVAGASTLLTTNMHGSVAADLSNARFGKLKLVGIPPKGIFDLTKATADVFQDEPASWARNGKLVLDGFQYTDIHMTNVTLKQRRQWLRSGTSVNRARYGGYQPVRYLPQPYEALAAAYQQVGEDQNARKLLLAKHRHRNRATPWGRWYSRLWNFTQDALVGYGYAPWRAALWLIGLFMLGTIIFRYGAHPVSTTTPPQKFTFAASLLYTFDLLLPIIGLNSTGTWRSASGTGEVLTAVLVIFGWVLGATIVAAATRVLTRT